MTVCNRFVSKFEKLLMAYTGQLQTQFVFDPCGDESADVFSFPLGLLLIEKTSSSSYA
jgi:hypothetical protein